MTKNLSLLFLVIIVLVGLSLLSMRSRSLQNSQTIRTVDAELTIPEDCTPTFVDGGGPYYQANAPLRNTISPSENQGEKLIVSGQVLEKDCVTPVTNVIVDIWQANETGNYEDEWYRGRVMTNDKGEYTFTTVVPKGYGEGTAFRPPHIHFKIWQNERERITSQMFLPASRAQGIEEAYIMKLETKEDNGEVVHYGTHNIVLH